MRFLQGPRQRGRVAEHGGQIRCDLPLDLHSRLAEGGPRRVQGLLHEAGHLDRLSLVGPMARVGAGEVEHLLDQSRQASALVAHQRPVARHPLAPFDQAVGEVLARGADHRDRRAQLVGHRGHEFHLPRGQPLGPPSGEGEEHRGGAEQDQDGETHEEVSAARGRDESVHRATAMGHLERPEAGARLPASAARHAEAEARSPEGRSVARRAALAQCEAITGRTPFRPSPGRSHRAQVLFARILEAQLQEGHCGLGLDLPGVGVLRRVEDVAGSVLTRDAQGEARIVSGREVAMLERGKKGLREHVLVEHDEGESAEAEGEDAHGSASPNGEAARGALVAVTPRPGGDPRSKMGAGAMSTGVPSSSRLMGPVRKPRLGRPGGASLEGAIADGGQVRGPLGGHEGPLFGRVPGKPERLARSAAALREVDLLDQAGLDRDGPPAIVAFRIALEIAVAKGGGVELQPQERPGDLAVEVLGQKLGTHLQPGPQTAPLGFRQLPRPPVLERAQPEQERGDEGDHEEQGIDAGTAGERRHPGRIAFASGALGAPKAGRALHP